MRNSVVLHNFAREDLKDWYPANVHFWGVNTLLNYTVNRKLKFGLSIYGDVKYPLGPNSNGAIYRTFEATLKASYQIK